ncbi:MAG: Hsp20/alpha crystallin family protein [Patescibacteria group bacterium]|nr:Hsp20/alpha crystallin family protein [Patescibacteria group bacterium]
MDNNKFATRLDELSDPVDEDSNSNQPKIFVTDSSLANEEMLGDDYSGQLAVDVYQTPKEIIIKSTIAGVQPEDLDISINNDMVIIKGYRRQEETVSEDNYIYKECHWGGFSRSIILPVDIKEDKVKASLKNGVLTIILPKSGKSKVRVVEVQDEA